MRFTDLERPPHEAIEAQRQGVAPQPNVSLRVGALAWTSREMGRDRGRGSLPGQAALPAGVFIAWVGESGDQCTARWPRRAVRSLSRAPFRWPQAPGPRVTFSGAQALPDLLQRTWPSTPGVCVRSFPLGPGGRQVGSSHQHQQAGGWEQGRNREGGAGEPGK